MTIGPDTVSDLRVRLQLLRREISDGRNIRPRSFLHGPRCARSVLSRPRTDIFPVQTFALS